MIEYINNSNKFLFLINKKYHNRNCVSQLQIVWSINKMKSSNNIRSDLTDYSFNAGTFKETNDVSIKYITELCLVS